MASVCTGSSVRGLGHGFLPVGSKPEFELPFFSRHILIIAASRPLFGPVFLLTSSLTSFNSVVQPCVSDDLRPSSPKPLSSLRCPWGLHTCTPNSASGCRPVTSDLFHFFTTPKASLSLISALIPLAPTSICIPHILSTCCPTNLLLSPSRAARLQPPSPCRLRCRRPPPPRRLLRTLL
jgi:hypothetical protein